MNEQNQPHINQVRVTLLDSLKTLGQLGKTAADGKPLDIEQIKAHVQLANAMKGIADTLVDTGRVEVDYIKATGADRSNFLEGEPGPLSLPAANTVPEAHNPFPVSKVHRLQG